MKPEQLQPLLLDRALGELPPEVAALLDEHLTRDPAARRLADELDQTLVLARAATRPDPAAQAPVFDPVRWHQIARSERGQARRSQWFRLAACVAFGATIGWLAHSTTVSSPVLASIDVPADPVSPSTSALNSAGLWSRSRIVVHHAVDRPSGRVRASRTPMHSPFPFSPSPEEQR